MPNYTREAIAARLVSAPPRAPGKAIMLKLPDDLAETLTFLAAAMTQASGRRVSRNMLIIDAIEGFAAAPAAQAGLAGRRHHPLPLGGGQGGHHARPAPGAARAEGVTKCAGGTFLPGPP